MPILSVNVILLQLIGAVSLDGEHGLYRTFTLNLQKVIKVDG